MDPRSTVSQNLVRKTERQGIPGLQVDTGRPVAVRTWVNSNPNASQVDDVVVANGITASASFGVNVDGYPIRAVATGTQATDAALLVAAINADPFVYGRLSAAYVSGGTIRLTSQYPGRSYVVDGGTTGITSITSITTATQVEDVCFGRWVLATGPIEEGGPDLCAVTASTAATPLSLRSIVLTVTYAAACTYYVKFIPKTGEDAFIVQVLAVTDSTATAAAIVAALDAKFAALSYKADSSNALGVITIVSTLKGWDFDVEIWRTATASADFVVTSDNVQTGTSIDDLFAGIVLFREDNSTPDNASGDGYTYGKPFPTSDDVDVWVEAPASGVEYRGDVYVEMDPTSANKGKLYPTNSATRIRTRHARYIRPARAGAFWSAGLPSAALNDLIAVVRVTPYKA